MRLLILFIIGLGIAVPAWGQDQRALQLKIDAQCKAYGEATKIWGAQQASEQKSKPADGLEITATIVNPRKVKQCNGQNFRIPPQYPADRKLARDAPNACVFLKFDVATNGKTENISVVQRYPDKGSSRLNKFNKAAIEAVERWCYEPNVVDGQLVKRENVTTNVSFLTRVRKQDWENPVTDKQIKMFAENFAAVSEAECNAFSDAQKYLQDDPDSHYGPTPSAASFPGFVNAKPVSRVPPQWPATISPEWILHACTFARFDLNKEGKPENIEIVYRTPTISGANEQLEIFNQHTVEAISKWQYEPARFNDEPVEQKNIVTRLTFLSQPSEE